MSRPVVIYKSCRWYRQQQRRGIKNNVEAAFILHINNLTTWQPRKFFKDIFIQKWMVDRSKDRSKEYSDLNESKHSKF